MPERTPTAAVRIFGDRMRRALQCVTDAYVLLPRKGYQPASYPHTLSLIDDSVPLRGRYDISLSVRNHYRIVPMSGGRTVWMVETAAYFYAIEDTDGREIVAYHWHPNVPEVPYPHLHVGPGVVRRDVRDRAGLQLTANALRPDIAGAHLPTHHIPIEEFVRLLITQFGVRPRRSDWDIVLRS